MKHERQSLGQKGEQLAEKYLQNKGYKFLERNFRFNRGEIDLIFEFNSDIVIVEVKSVRMVSYGEGEERITRKKKEKLIATTYAFLDLHKEFEGEGVRFDVVVVNFARFPAAIIHHEGAFWEEG